MDGIRKVLEQHAARLQESIRLMENSKKFTSERRGNDLIDTTKKTIDEEMLLLSEIEGSLERHATIRSGKTS
jgi:hypothetical protein